MIDRLKTEGARLDRKKLTHQLETHRRQVLKRLEKSDYMEVLAIDYPSLVTSPEEIAPKIIEFVGEDRLTHPEAMVSVVDSKLHRQKTAPTDPE